MPEELNRVLTDQIAELHFTTEWNCTANLTREGIPIEAVHFVGNTMIDSLERLRGSLDVPGALLRAGVAPRGFALVTLHRPSNVDDPEQLTKLVDTLALIARRLPVVWPVHVRVTSRLERQEAELLLRAAREGVVCCEPLSYSEFLALLSQARIVLTDSGGVQEESTVLGIPCLTLRTSTERPVTLMEGTNRLVDPYDPEAIMAAVEEVLSEPLPKPKRPLRWDGRAAERIVGVIAEWAVARDRGTDAH
jgi:UDP-N-acetylglucosamine 2-epimerase (non-hydrolysing)